MYRLLALLASFGTIGGADGPTVIMVTGGVSELAVVLAAAVLAALLIALGIVIFRKVKNTKRRDMDNMSRFFDRPNQKAGVYREFFEQNLLFLLEKQPRCIIIENRVFIV